MSVWREGIRQSSGTGCVCVVLWLEFVFEFHAVPGLAYSNLKGWRLSGALAQAF